MIAAVSEEPELDRGTAGDSARREHRRRRDAREARIRARHPRIGRLIAALQGPPVHERVWLQGARGEELTAAVLTKRCRPEVVVLHDRRPAGRRANIDHIAICPSGVWVIDSKAHSGKVSVERPWFGAPTLRIDGRDQSKLVAQLKTQVALVDAALATTATSPRAPVRGALSFTADGLPLLRALTVDGVPLLYPRQLAKRLNARGALGPDQRQAIAATLATHFPPA